MKKRFLYFFLSTELLIALLSCTNNSKSHKDQVFSQDSIRESKEKNTLEKLHEINPDDALRYFSGNIPSLHDNPCIYINKNKKRVFVVGKKFYMEFSVRDQDRITETYREILNDSIPGTRVNVNGKDVYYVETNDLLPSGEEAKKIFGEEKYSLLYKTGNNVGFEVFSGYRDGYFDRPLVYSISGKLYLLAKGVNKEFEKKDLNDAIKELIRIADSN